MPELQVLLQHLVVSAVERATLPLVQKQRELEAALKTLQNAQKHYESPIASPAKAVPESVSSLPTIHLDTRAAVSPSTAVTSRDVVTSAPTTPLERPVTYARPAVTSNETTTSPAAIPVEYTGVTDRSRRATAVTYDTSSQLDIPPEFYGARRKKVVLWMFAVGALALLLLVIALSAASHM
jgi:hypothetical protein